MSEERVFDFYSTNILPLSVTSCKYPFINNNSDGPRRSIDKPVVMVNNDDHIFVQ